MSEKTVDLRYIAYHMLLKIKADHIILKNKSLKNHVYILSNKVKIAKSHW